MLRREEVVEKIVRFVQINNEPKNIIEEKFDIGVLAVFLIIMFLILIINL